MAELTKNEAKIEMVQMADARKNLSELTSSVESGRQKEIVLCRRGKPSVLIVSHSRCAPILSSAKIKNPQKRRKRQISWLITEQWLGSAPEHLRAPQLAELEQLNIDSLLALFKANPNKLTIKELENAGISRTLVERLKKRRRLAQSIQEAEEDGLYEMAEHSTSEIDLD